MSFLLRSDIGDYRLSEWLDLRYTVGMFNKTFYTFVFSFMAVVVGTLLFILVVGIGADM